MTEAAVVRYLVSHGWAVIEDGWCCLMGVCDSPVCVETAYHLQKRREMATA